MTSARIHHNPQPRVLRADETLSALTTEASGAFRALKFRAGRTNGMHVSREDWEQLREQWRAIEIIAGHARTACERALREGTHAR